MTNPLIPTADPFQLPAFDQLLPEQAEPAIDEVLARNRADLAQLLEVTAGNPRWETFIEPLEDQSDRLSRTFGPINHLFGVLSTASWRAAYTGCLPKVVAYSLEVSQNEALFHAYERLAAAPEFAQASATRKKVVADALRDFKLSGIGLPPEEKARFSEAALALSDLQSRFEENLLDAVQAWSMQVTDAGKLAGMTGQGKAQAAEKARAKNLEGFLLTLDFPSYDAVISHADDRELRRTLYEATATRASELGPQAGKFDNTELMAKILALRFEEAQLLGYANFAELSLATKMATSPDAVETFLLDLARRARPAAEAELAELKAYAHNLHGIDDFQAWDSAYYAEKLKAEKLGFSDEALQPYFPAARVIDGMFKLVERLYNVNIRAVDGIKTWHPDVTTYALFEGNEAEGGSEIGLFYLDPYARDDKRGGAWMDECLSRRRTGKGLQRPVAYLTCNFAPPLPGKPALLTHDEVLTLFHEFGHGLHHLLTRVDEGSVSGIRGVAWDAVELPSQFMENWCYDRATLLELGRHWQTGAPIPDDLLNKLLGSRSFLAGLATVRQIELALFDLRLHRDYDPSKGAQVLETLAQVRREVGVLMPPDWNRMPNSFSHVFAGGYAAGYYSYKWAEVLSADAFAAFEESGFALETGQRFRETVLALGGSQEAMEVFKAFRGREPQIDALLKQSGLAA